MAAGHVVLAAGPWTGRLAASLGVDLPVFPVRGQMMALPSKSAPRHIVWGSAGYLVPKANGLVFAGATVEKVGFRRRTTAAGLRGLAAMASTLAPRVGAFAPVDSWAGLRPGSADGLPLLGPLPGWEGVSVATGHYRNGILLSPVTGRLIARSIIDGSPDGALARSVRRASSTRRSCAPLRWRSPTLERQSAGMDPAACLPTSLWSTAQGFNTSVRRFDPDPLTTRGCEAGGQATGCCFDVVGEADGADDRHGVGAGGDDLVDVSLVDAAYRDDGHASRPPSPLAVAPGSPDA